MSIRLEMLQVARLAPTVLGEATENVRAFLHTQLSPQGAGLDRDGQPDLYYTIFVLAGLQALQEPIPAEPVAGYLRTFGDGAALDFVHLGALARCWAAIDRVSEAPPGLLEKIAEFRSQDGSFTDAYGGFVALGAYQDMGTPFPDPLRLVQALKFLETPDGAWGNAPGLKTGATPATAAAVTLLGQLGMPLNREAVGAWLLAQAHEQGGFLAVPRAPLPDLLSTATALHALAVLEVEPPRAVRERCLDFIDTLWNAEGGFHGHWADDHLDAEYTFYALLALGHLSVFEKR